MREKESQRNKCCCARAAVCFLAAIVLAGASGCGASGRAVLRPEIDGNWRQVAGDPDLGKYTSEKQQPVDFAVWQAADGTWQLWSCIRNTRCGGHTRLFYRWEGKKLTDANWQPMGISAKAAAQNTRRRYFAGRRATCGAGASRLRYARAERLRQKAAGSAATANVLLSWRLTGFIIFSAIKDTAEAI